MRLRHLSIELLVIVAAVGALFINNHWESAAVTFLFMLGAWLESRTMSRTRVALKSLLDAAPVTATVLRGGETVEVAAHGVQLGEIVLVKAGQRLPVDGEVIEGFATLNEAAITSEPIPAEKASGSHLFAGTLAKNRLLRDARIGYNRLHSLVGLLRQSILGRLAGYDYTSRRSTWAS